MERIRIFAAERLISLEALKLLDERGELLFMGMQLKKHNESPEYRAVFGAFNKSVTAAGRITQRTEFALSKYTVFWAKEALYSEVMTALFCPSTHR